MKITLGLGLDSKKTTTPVSSIGEKVVGPLGFLSILETQCGIPALSESPTARIIQYMSCLKANDNSSRFTASLLPWISSMLQKHCLIGETLGMRQIGQVVSLILYPHVCKI